MGVYADDQSHAYINTYVTHTNNEFGHVNGYTDQLISSTADINHQHHHHLLQHHQSELSTTTDDGTGYHEYVDSTVIHNGLSDEIIVQATDGQFYRQIQNVYLNGDDANNTTTVEFFPMIADYLTETDEGQNEQQHHHHHPHQYYQHYEMDSVDFDQNCTIDQQQQTKHSQNHMNDVILMPPNSTQNDVMECHVELMSHHQNQYYKNEYTVLEPMNPQMIQRHSEQQQELTAGLRPVNTTVTLDEQQKEQHRLLLETKISPLLAAVNDITSRDEQFQLYLAQHQIETNDLDVYQHTNDTFVNTNECEMNVMASTTQAVTTQVSAVKTNQSSSSSVTIDSNYQLTTTSTDISNGKIMSSNLSNEYVDINEFVANRSQHYNGVIMDCDQTTQENLLQRRPQKQIQKNPNECK